MMAYSGIAFIFDIIFGFKTPHIGLPLLCATLRIIIILADIIALYLILRNKSIGVWIYVATAFFIVLLSMAFPMFMSPFIKYLNIAMKAGLLIMLYLKHDGLTGYQTLGMAKIDGRYIDEWISGRKRYM